MEGELWGLAVHPSTHSFVTASDDKSVRIWDIATKVSCGVSPTPSVRLSVFNPVYSRLLVLRGLKWSKNLQG